MICRDHTLGFKYAPILFIHLDQSMLYSFIDWTGPVPAPPRLPNGGLYTGEAFAAGAAWGNVPVAPDASAHVRFIGQIQPPGAVGQQLPHSRPGSHVEPVARADVDAAKYPGMQCLVHTHTATQGHV
jgi:hypothetical protein